MSAILSFARRLLILYFRQVRFRLRQFTSANHRWFSVNCTFNQANVANFIWLSKALLLILIRILFTLLTQPRTIFRMVMSCSFLPSRYRLPAQRAFRIFFYLLLLIVCVTYNLPWRTQHLALISTTYFPFSASYSPNSMVVLFNAQKGFWPPWPLVCVSRNETHVDKHYAKIRYAFTPIFICGWSVYLAVCPVVAAPLEFGLRDVQFSSNTVNIPYRKTRMDRRLDVVACFSPLFYNERWQLIVPTLEIYRQLGVSLQVYYIQSMLVEILQFMQIYERLNITKLETWTKLSVMELSAEDSSLSPLTYDPNAELEWRNQAAAHTDCLLNYKESAEFIIVSDIDDVLFPRLGKTFVEEFRHLTNKFPWAAGFSYNRYNTELITSNEPDDFSLSALINSARIAKEWEDPKYVVRPTHVQSVWLHWPGIIDKGRMETVDDALNFMVHFRNWSMIDYGSSIMPRVQRSFELFHYQIADVIRPQAISKIDANFRQFLQQNAPAAEYFDKLPRTVRYYPLIAECYNRIFYGRAKRPQNCPGPMRCKLPVIEGVKCALAQHDHFSHKAINARVVVHFSTSEQGRFMVSNTGCRI